MALTLRSLGMSRGLEGMATSAPPPGNLSLPRAGALQFNRCELRAGSVKVLLGYHLPVFLRRCEKAESKGRPSCPVNGHVLWCSSSKWWKCSNWRLIYNLHPNPDLSIRTETCNVTRFQFKLPAMFSESDIPLLLLVLGRVGNARQELAACGWGEPLG